MNKKLVILGLSTLLTCCLGNGPTFERDGLIGQLGTPVKLEHYKHKDGKAFQYADTATFVITDRQSLKEAIEEIKKADDPEPYKGAGWDKIKIYYADTILNINTDNKRIGLFADGQFYDLGDGNFITVNLDDK